MEHNNSIFQEHTRFFFFLRAIIMYLQIKTEKLYGDIVNDHIISHIYANMIIMIFYIFLYCVPIRNHESQSYDSNNCYLVIKQICNSAVRRMLFSSLKIFMSRLYFVEFSTKSHFATHVTAEHIHAFKHTQIYTSKHAIN